MKKITYTLLLLVVLCFGQAWAQTSTTPVFGLPIAAGNSAYVDMDVNNHSPLINQIGIAASPTSSYLMVAAAAGGTAIPFPTLNLSQPCSDINDSFPPCTKVGLIIDHGNGIYTIYAGLDSLSLINSGISSGDYVYAGQPLALAGLDSITGTIRFDFEAWTCMGNPPCGGPITIPDSLTIAPPAIDRNLQSTTDRAGNTYLYDTHDIVPMFGFATGPRTLYAGEWISVSGSATGGYKMSNVQAEEKVSLYPNPSKGAMTVSISLMQDRNVNLQVLNLQGAVVATPIVNEAMQAGRNEISLDLGNLANGMYLYRVTTGEQSFSGKLQIMH